MLNAAMSCPGHQDDALLGPALEQGGGFHPWNPLGSPLVSSVVFIRKPGDGLLIGRRNPMAKKKKQTETTIPSDDLVAMAVNEGQALIAEGKTKVEAAMAIYRHFQESPQEVVLKAFIDGASLTPKGALTYWYNCRRKLSRERSE